jgi:pSer/pThr/pTyr-binding forkhead associated (FHA) protein
MSVTNRTEKSNGRTSADAAPEAKTMLLTSKKEKVIEPRLVCTSASGESEIYPLNKPKLVIGRSIEADLSLLDPLVSRKHCVIETQEDGFVARNVSTTNPLKLNDKSIVEKRLFSGDVLKIGSATLAFISDRPEDARMLDTKTIAQKWLTGWSLWVIVFVLFLIAGYIGYFQAYTPLRIKWALTSVSKQIETGKHQTAQNTLKNLLALNLSQERTNQAMEMLVDSVLAVAQQKAQYEDLLAAMTYLKTFLAEYGANKEADVLWDRLDYYRLSQGQQLESAEKLQAALRHYAAIKEDSIYFEEAHKAIRRIWLAHQQNFRRDQTLVQLLKDADRHFRAQQYLTPVNQNAFILYQAVLTLEPEHKLAISRIEHMKNFYSQNGEKFFAQEKWSKALSFFERYYLIDTDNKQINDKLKICREKYTATDASNPASNSTKNSLKKKSRDKHGTHQNSGQAENREEIMRLLEESGTESSWIMKYLFEDQQGENDTEKPW